MIPRSLRVACLLSLVAGAAAAQGTPRSVSECERLKNDLAYNQCLAMFGPEAKNVGGGDGGSSASSSASAPSPAPAVSADAAAAAGIPSADEPELAESGRRGRRGRSARRSGGRQSVSFAVASADEASPRRWRSRSRRRH